MKLSREGQNRALYKLLQSKSLRNMFSPIDSSNQLVSEPYRESLKCRKHSLKARFTHNKISLCEICAVEYAYERKALIHIKSGIQMQPKKQFIFACSSVTPLRERVKDLRDCGQKQEILLKFVTQLETLHGKLESLNEQLKSINIGGLVKFQEEQVRQVCQKLEQNLIDQVNRSQSNTNYKLVGERVNGYLEDVKCMERDIGTNLESIVERMEISPLTEIINKYQLKLQFYSKECNDMKVLRGSVLNLFHLELQRMSRL